MAKTHTVTLDRISSYTFGNVKFEKGVPVSVDAATAAALAEKVEALVIAETGETIERAYFIVEAIPGIEADEDETSETEPATGGSSGRGGRTRSR